MPRSRKVYTGRDVSTIGVKEIFDRSIKQFGTPVNQTDSKPVENETYNFRNAMRGFGIVICIENFPEARLSPRPYAQEELENMHEMLTKLEFLTVMFTDLTTKQMMDVLAEAASRKEVNSIADTFACVIGSHGNELEAAKARNSKNKKQTEKLQFFHHVVYGTDGPLLTSDIISIFEDDRCRELKEKPKLFFIQACRSRMGNDCKSDMGIDISVIDEKLISKRKHLPDDKMETGSQATITESEKATDESDNTNESNTTDTTSGDDADSSDEEKDDNLTPGAEDEQLNKSNSNKPCSGGDHKEFGLFSKLIPFKKKKKKKKMNRLPIYLPYCPNNFFIMFATSEEKFAYGRDGQGGWMLYTLNRVVQGTTNIHKIEFLQLMTIVNNVVATHFATNAEKLKGAKTAVTVEHKLVRDIYFTRKRPL